MLKPFSLEAARRTFSDITDEDHEAQTSELDELLKQLDTVPLAVKLMASAAQSGESLDELRKAWVRERTALLSDGSTSKSTNIEASIRISLKSKLVRQYPVSLRLLFYSNFFLFGVLFCFALFFTD